jgi:methionyl-tRNA synthetase
MSQWGEKLLAHYEANPDFIAPSSRRNEVISFVKGGMHDLAVSRTSFRWGIPVPGDEAHVMYVWIDALTNYLTAVGFPDETAPDWRFWPADLHVVGKDILRFHAVIWPAILMAAGIAPPRRVFAHGWWVADGEKMSKSLGNVIDPAELVATFGLDAVRYFLMREIPFGNDGNFSRKAFISRMNVELANDLGNLAQRSLSLIARNLEGRLPARGAATEDDALLLAAAEALPGLLRATMDRQAFGDALEEVWKVIRAANSYIDRQAPWALRKTDMGRMGDVLRVLADVLRICATMLQPFMPDAMAKMLDQLGVAAELRDVAALASPLPAAILLPPPSGVFPRFVEETA